MAQALPYLIAAGTAYQGVQTYMAAKQQAAVLNQNAQAAVDKSKADAVIIAQNYQDQQQQISFQQSVDRYNQQSKLQNFTQEILAYGKEKRSALASLNNKLGFGGQFSEVLDATENIYDDQLNAFYTKNYNAFLQDDLQDLEYDRQGLALGYRSSAEQAGRLHTGRMQARNLNIQAQQTKFAGRQAMIGSFIQAGAGLYLSGAFKAKPDVGLTSIDASASGSPSLSSSATVGTTTGYQTPGMGTYANGVYTMPDYVVTYTPGTFTLN